MDFGEKGAKSFSIMAAAEGAGCTVTLRLDSQKGPVIGSAVIKATGSLDNYRAFAAKIQKAMGVHDLYLCFGDADGQVRLDWWTFKK